MCQHCLAQHRRLLLRNYEQGKERGSKFYPLFYELEVFSQVKNFLFGKQKFPQGKVLSGNLTQLDSQRPVTCVVPAEGSQHITKDICQKTHPGKWEPYGAASL